MLSSIGLGFLAVNAVMQWVLPATLALGLVGLLLNSRAPRRFGILALAGAGSVVLYAGWLAAQKPALYSGMALLLAASISNLWSQRHPKLRLVQIGRKGISHHGQA